MSQLQVTGEAKIRDIQGPVVANSGVITALNGAANQYVRGDGTLASFPTSGGGGSSVSYYLNGSVNQGTFGGSTYYQMSKNAIVGTGTNFSASANGLIAQFITDANDPDVVSIPSGNWNVEFFMNVSASSGALASFYVEFYKYNGSTFTLLATNVATPEQLTNTTTVDAYYTSVAMPLSSMAVTDRLAIRIFVNVAGKTVTLYTEDNRLCQVVTTFSKGLASLNNLTDQSQYLTTGTSGTNFAIVSSGDTHTFNLPVASATNTGKLSNTDWSTFNNKQAALSFTAPLVNTSNTISIPAATSLVDGYLDNLDWVNFNTAYNDSIISAAVTGTTTKTLTLNQQDGGTITASWTDINTDAVTSVFGRTGAVVAQSGDYTTTQVTEGTNLYYTDARSRGALSFTAGSGAYNSTTGVITIPTNNNQITNGAGYITSSALTSYVPYTGATGNVDLGTFNLSTLGTLQSKYVYIIGNGTNSGFLSFSQYATPDLSGTNTNSIYTTSNNKVNFRFWQSGLSWKNFNFDVTSLTAGSDRTYTMPDASGTLALTSNLSSYLPLAGGALTGALNGTSAAFSSFVNAFSFTAIGGTSNAGQISLKHTGAISVGDGYVTIAADSSNTLGIYFFNSFSAKFSISALTNNRTYTLPDGTGTLALTSDLSAYLPLTGGTLTGGLSGTTATFSGLGTFYQLTMTGATAGRIFYAQTGGVVSQSGNLNWNETNGMLGVGTPNPSAVITAFSNNAATQFKASGNAPAFTFSESLTTSTRACVFGLATAANQFITGTAAGDMAIANQSTVAGAIVFGTGTTERMRMSPSGRLLVGTSVDSGALFQVAGAATFSSSVTAGAITSSVATGNGSFYINNASLTNKNWTLIPSTSGTETDLLFFYTGASAGTRMTLTNAGNVGIGTINPFAIADINTSINGTGSSALQLGVAGTRTGQFFASSTEVRIGSVTSVPLRFYTNDAEAMRITSGGNVGIGTSSPNTRLSIQNDGASVYSNSGWRNTSSTAELYIGVGGSSVSATFAQNNAYIVNAGASALVLGTSDAERMRITSGGNVGIGTSSPTTILTVRKPIDSSAYGAGTRMIDFKSFFPGFDTETVKASIYAGVSDISELRTDNGYLVFMTANSGILYERMRIEKTGQIQIKQPADGFTEGLRWINTLGNRWTFVNGGDNNFYIGFNEANRGIFNSSTGVYTPLSDINKKKDFEESTIGLDAVLGLKPTLYRIKSDETEGDKELGFIAQEVKEFIPQAFVESGEDENKFIGLNYNAITAGNTKAIQELYQLVLAQDAKIEELKALINK